MSPATHVLYFAYGSNMLGRRIRARVPSARPLGVATLRGHELRWHKVGRDRSGKCDVVVSATAEHAVVGVLYEFLASEKPLLDAIEGLGAGYDEKLADVDSAAGPVSAWLYYATATDPLLLPYTWYKALVVAGAREHALPADYVARLEAAAAVDDEDAARHAENRALVHTG